MAVDMQHHHTAGEKQSVADSDGTHGHACDLHPFQSLSRLRCAIPLDTVLRCILPTNTLSPVATAVRKTRRCSNARPCETALRRNAALVPSMLNPASKDGCWCLRFFSPTCSRQMPGMDGGASLLHSAFLSNWQPMPHAWKMSNFPQLMC